jgi:hypothetical protein
MAATTKRELWDGGHDSMWEEEGIGCNCDEPRISDTQVLIQF